MRVCIPATNVRGEGEADFVLGSSAVARSFMWVALNLGHVCAGPMCSGCASTYYLSPDATCKPCPDEGDMLRLKLLAAVPFALMMLGLYVAVSLALFRLEVTTGSPKNAAIRTALNESRKFCICFGLSFQMMASSALGSKKPMDITPRLSSTYLPVRRYGHGAADHSRSIGVQDGIGTGSRGQV